VKALLSSWGLPWEFVMRASVFSSSWRKGVPNFDRTWLISVKRSSDRNSGRQRLKMECATCNTPLLTTVLSGVRREIRSSTRVSHRCQKSLSAIALMASPSCACKFAGTDTMRPMSSLLIATTSLSGSL
jgi:hypothetical protein